MAHLLSSIIHDHVTITRTQASTSAMLAETTIKIFNIWREPAEMFAQPATIKSCSNTKTIKIEIEDSLRWEKSAREEQ